VTAVEIHGAEAIIPPKKNRVAPQDYDRHTCKERNEVAG
jgi:hypothetical protein